MATNVTVKIDDDLAHAAKVYAARHGTSVSRLVADQLARLIDRDRAYEAAKVRAIQRLHGALALGWRKPAGRDELHKRED